MPVVECYVDNTTFAVVKNMAEVLNRSVSDICETAIQETCIDVAKHVRSKLGKPKAD